jgi:hypothetical protein
LAEVSLFLAELVLSVSDLTGLLTIDAVIVLCRSVPFTEFAAQGLLVALLIDDLLIAGIKTVNFNVLVGRRCPVYTSG